MANPRHKQIHPIIVATAVVIPIHILVSAVTTALQFGDLGPRALNFLFSITFNIGFSLAFGVLCLIIWKLVRFSVLRIVVSAIALIAISFFTFLSLSDPILIAIIGERLTPSTLEHFAGFDLFLSDYFWKPVRAYWYAVFPAVALLATYIVWSARLFWTLGLHPNASRLRWTTIASSIAVSCIMMGGALALSPSLQMPVAISYVEETLGSDATTLPLDEAEAVAFIRNFVGLPPGAAWVDAHFPLVYKWVKAPKAVAVKPDIFVFIVESMRGENLRPFNPTGNQLFPAPALDGLAAKGVTFRHYLSTGFPSGPGFIGITSGAWMHSTKRLDAAYTETAFDRLGHRLISFGYHTGIVAYDLHQDDKQHWVQDAFQDVISASVQNLEQSDEVTNQLFKNWLSAADSQKNILPLFGVFMTKEPHLPYLYQDGTGAWVFGKNLAENYQKSFAGVDYQLGKAFDLLRARSRWKDTIVFVIGDHANYLNQGQSSGLPINDTEFTGAIVAGGADALGHPRVVVTPTGHADLATTILELVGDARPAMSLGRNILSDTSQRPARALAIRAGGTRLDIADQSMFLPLHSSEGAFVAPSNLPSEKIGDQMPPAADLELVVKIWSWMIENDRVWSPKFLK